MAKMPRSTGGLLRDVGERLLSLGILTRHRRKHVSTAVVLMQTALADVRGVATATVPRCRNGEVTMVAWHHRGYGVLVTANNWRGKRGIDKILPDIAPIKRGNGKKMKEMATTLAKNYEESRVLEILAALAGEYTSSDDGEYIIAPLALWGGAAKVVDRQMRKLYTPVVGSEPGLLQRVRRLAKRAGKVAQVASKTR